MEGLQEIKDLSSHQKLSETCLPRHIQITPEILEKAELELGETPERRKESIKELRRLINGEKDFRPKMDEKFLLRFLRTRKFNPEKAFAALKNYYVFKLRYSKILTDFKPSDMKHVMDLNIMTILPYRDPGGAVVGAVSAGSYDIDKAQIDEVFATALIFGENMIDSEVTQICGVVGLVDLKGLSLKIIRQLASPKLLYRVVRALQDCFPTRIKAIHLINEPFYFTLVFNIVKAFLSEKLKKRIQFHGSNLTKLHQEIPPSILPKEFGGELGPMESSECNRELSQTEEIYEKNSKYGFQEKRAQFIKKKSSMAIGLYA